LISGHRPIIERKWEPELRYRSVGSTTRAEARSMIDAAIELLRVI
jgi:hypothetical protein